MQGMGTNLLFLDEIFGMFDGPTASLAVKLLVHLREAHGGSIVAVTHDEKIRSMLPFDKTWTVEKRQHISTIRETKND
jgi:ABC-type lipoprotein export system ATPase subunit